MCVCAAHLCPCEVDHGLHMDGVEDVYLRGHTHTKKTLEMSLHSLERDVKQEAAEETDYL